MVTDNQFKEIHIGVCIDKRIKELNIDTQRILNFVKISESDLSVILSGKSIDCNILLRFSKLLEYDFFRLYSQHLILYSPPSSMNPKTKSHVLPNFKKNIYTREIIDFVLELIRTGQKSRQEIIDQYRIPKTTLYKWMAKYNRD